ncbi:integrase family protein [Bradyrhizobium sp. C9]|uniref:tyrosine-type recombinase/integrase n=1 Tax=Bradyrhizobium sp. C9 TaxID=142585 RepID=UPI000BE82F2A|nr:integrase family protein [Bradyrhizobium sp. C9]PDT75083.1 hypothetical protein CO675_22665 [Bradyrhizobium sp. C9]
MKFTSTSAVRKLRTPEGRTEIMIWDDSMPGFGVRLRASGASSYICQWQIGSRQGRETIGRISVLDLDTAREKARHILGLAQTGKSPKQARLDEERRISQALGPLINRYLEAMEGRWASKYRSDIERYLRVYFKRLHGMSPTDITRADVSAELATIERDSGKTCRNRSRAALSTFFNWLIAEGVLEHNPAEKTAKAQEVPRDRALSAAEIAKLWTALDADVFSQDERDALRLMILTAQRAGQIGNLRVSEIGDDRLTWDRARAKNKALGRHVLPLAPMAKAIIDSRTVKDRTFVFGYHDLGLTNWTRLKQRIDDIVRFNEPWVFHDLRRTAKTIMSEHLDVPGEVSESILNHGKRGMDQVYNSAVYIRQKLEALTKWEGYIMSAVDAQDTRQAA